MRMRPRRSFSKDLNKPSIFLDWFGVLADNYAMTRDWREVEARILHGKFGGSISKWMLVHDRAFTWYQNYWKKYGPNSSQQYKPLWKQATIGWVRRTLKWGGIRPPESERTLFRFNRDLTYQVTRRIDPAFPNVREVLRKLEPDFRLFLVSGAESIYAKGALEATGLKRFFERTFSPDKLNAFKGSMDYWTRILQLSRSAPARSALVDDNPRFLRVPSRIGLTTILGATKDASADNTAQSEALTNYSIPTFCQVLRSHKAELEWLCPKTN